MTTLHSERSLSVDETLISEWEAKAGWRVTFRQACWTHLCSVSAASDEASTAFVGMGVAHPVGNDGGSSGPRSVCRSASLVERLRLRDGGWCGCNTSWRSNRLHFWNSALSFRRQIPRSAARLSFPPVSVRPETAGSGGRCPAGKIVVPGMLDELAEEECTSEQPAASKATVAPATARTACTRRDTAEIYKV